MFHAGLNPVAQGLSARAVGSYLHATSTHLNPSLSPICFGFKGKYALMMDLVLLYLIVLLTYKLYVIMFTVFLGKIFHTDCQFDI